VDATEAEPPSLSKGLAQWLVALLLSMVLLTPVVVLGWIDGRASRALLRTWSKLQARLFGVDVEVVGIPSYPWSTLTGTCV
jgi:threonine/homoserine/homoserine lactone efflux protein